MKGYDLMVIEGRKETQKGLSVQILLGYSVQDSFFLSMGKNLSRMRIFKGGERRKRVTFSRFYGLFGGEEFLFL